MGEVLLDVSALEAPEPLQRAIEAAVALGEGQYLHMHHRMRPVHLYPWLASEGFASDTRRNGEDCEVFIWRREDTLAQRAAEAGASGLPHWRD